MITLHVLQLNILNIQIIQLIKKVYLNIKISILTHTYIYNVFFVIHFYITFKLLLLKCILEFVKTTQTYAHHTHIRYRDIYSVHTLYTSIHTYKYIYTYIFIQFVHFTILKYFKGVFLNKEYL